MSQTKLRFARDTSFHADLRTRVNAFLATSGQSARDLPRMYLKAGIILGSCAALWAVLMFVPMSAWLVVPLAICLGLALAGIGMAVQHDANHGAFSDRPWVNRLFGFMIDANGASSYVWRQKHNVVHHTYTNISGVDDDIELGPLARLAPAQKHHGWHRLQQLYMFPLYGMIHFKWAIFDDFYNLATGRVAQHKMPRPKLKDLVGLFGGKLLFFSWALVLPLFFHHWTSVLAVYCIASFVQGVALAVTFQLAHCVEEAGFPEPVAGGQLKRDWATHQLETTVDFARGNRVLSWWMGGLNYQVVHHLFPRVCHLHYPAISHILEEVATAHGLVYRHSPDFMTALRSHYRWLKRMGQPPALETVVEETAAAA